ncbi:intraflagellar transport protein 81, partial [Haematococcus lacustris]
MGDIHYIVDKLNSPPFSYNLTLLSFSEKTPTELLQLISDIFSLINPRKQKHDVSKEDPDQTVERLVNFLKIIKYKPNYEPATFRHLLSLGDKDVVYPILKWVVPQPQQLEKRAFVGHYLSFPDMPEEFSYDPDIMELKEEIKGLQQVFITTHKSNEAVKALNRDTQALKVRIKGLEEEKERLTDKVERTKAQVDKVADKASYMDVCVALRKQQDEEVTLSQQLQAQKTTLEKADAAYNKVAARLKELSSSFQEGSGTKLLEALTEDVKNLRFQVNERCPRELEKRQRRAAALQEAFTNGVNTESDLQRLAATAHSMHAQINEIMDRRAAADKSRQGDKSFMQLRQAQQMASMVNRKKEEVVAKLERLQEKKATLTAQFEKLTAADGAAAGMVSEEEWR